MTDSEDISISANLTPLPDRVGVDGLESKWRDIWDTDGTYTFDNPGERSAVYSIDTPPPTVSGSLHVGHVFSYTHTDIIARFKRMNGFHVFYPMGWDDNGLPTERRVQNYYGVRVDTSLKYDPDFKPPFEGTEGKKIQAKDQVPISRRNFIELCEKLTAQDEERFEELWRELGLSIDWSRTYHTIGDHAQRVAQKAFLHNLERGEAYQQDAPGLWDVTFQTAVAQAELESREYPGFYHRIAFSFEDGSPIYIETTRPELLPACVALIAHPDDERYKPYFGKMVTSPLFNVKVPILPRARRSRPRTRCRSHAATSSNCARSSPRKTKSASRSSGVSSACRSTGRAPTTRSATTRSAWRRRRSCTIWNAARRTSRTRRACGT